MTMQTENLLAASSRVALAAYLHDLGKFAERAGFEALKSDIDAHKTQYCPFRTTDAGGKNGYHTHVHAAYTGLAFDVFERNAPDLIQGDMSPFASRSGGQEITDSLVNAAAAHHRPDTFLQWIIATADRVASGFERDEFVEYNLAKDENETEKTGRNHYQARQLTLFEQINKQGTDTATGYLYRYPLKALSPKSIFPVKRDGYEPKDNEPARAEYAALWHDFLKSLEAIPKSHRQNWSLWLDHFDTAWQTFTHAIPSATAFGTKPDVSLYDHSKTTAALATALWRWHEANGQTDAAAAASLKDRSDWGVDKLLLIQGDFFGIQDFIFADGSQTNKAAAKLLRGRSFQVSLFTELAALKVLDALSLPPTSQITNAAGKFLIVAPNTEDVRRQLTQVKNEINQWFLQHSFGLAGLGLIGKNACCNDLLKRRSKTDAASPFKALLSSLFADLEKAKLQRFDLTANSEAVFSVDYSHGVCQYNGKLPADQTQRQGKASAALSRDQIKLGSALTHEDRLLVLRNPAGLLGEKLLQLEVPVFGYSVAFTQSESVTGKFGKLAQDGALVRCWDFSLPENLTDTLWHGYARRFINAYVPHFVEEDQWASDKYQGQADDVDFDKARFSGKTLNHIACEDRQPRRDREGWLGQVALMTLKGDVDNLGTIFQQGLTEPTFAKMAALSRQMNAFFAVWLPAICKTEFPNTYTVFAGGDDFFLIGPWHSTQKLAARMATEFKTYVAGNEGITFSAGMVMTKPGLPMHTLATQAEEALEAAKGNGLADAKIRKNALVLYGERVRWSDWGQVQAAQDQLGFVRETYDLSTGYVYGLMQLIDLAADTKNPEHAMWRSRFAYRTRRYVVDKIREPEKRQRAQTELSFALGKQGIEDLGTRYRIALFNHFYSQR
ncbi:type III-A CRISPR-associated protein Cas10/Csm1 [Rhodoferax antarcticus]|uniref:type III-A CRISPR-associated protein Cas10/Csm1 n=1 Tax=Rhodoferax antarcticus TaxID=81479 RepID=UPI002224085F|nr:type III-A CRISPR-associated protein Cas10/Csm1 [Rhodoferax antarcticus]MCW2313118.1 CRISPR-associated protein Csm1 [Rhodoferax antarcticus]